MYDPCKGHMVATLMLQRQWVGIVYQIKKSQKLIIAPLTKLVRCTCTVHCLLARVSLVIIIFIIIFKWGRIFMAYVFSVSRSSRAILERFPRAFSNWRRERERGRETEIGEREKERESNIYMYMYVVQTQNESTTFSITIADFDFYLIKNSHNIITVTTLIPVITLVYSSVRYHRRNQTSNLCNPQIYNYYTQVKCL